MKKSNVILQAAVAGAVMAMSASANAGTVATTFTTFASEIFGTGSNTTAITPAPVTYQFGVPVAAAKPISIYVALSGGALYVPGKVTLTDIVCIDAANATSNATSATISADSTFAVFSVTPTNGFNTNSTCTFTPEAASMDHADTALATSGGVITATWTNDAGAVSGSAIPSGGTNIDAAGTHSGNVAQSASAITGKMVASSSFPSGKSGGVATTQQIDVAATPTAAFFTTDAQVTSNTLLNLGALYFSEVSGIQDDGTGWDYSMGKTKAAGLGVVGSGDFTAADSSGAGKGFYLATAPDCATGAVGTPTFNTGKTTATLAGVATLAKDTPYYICVSVPAANTTVIPASAYTATATLKKTAASELTTSIASTALLTTTLNGQAVTVHNYVPTTVTGWTTWLRVINTGSVTADIKAALVDETTGVAGTAGVIISGLKAGGAHTVDPTVLEAAIGGAPAATARPRIRVSGPTNGLTVQSYIFTPGGSFTNVSAAQSKP